MTIVAGTIAISAKSMSRAMDKVRELTPRGTHQSIEQTVETINKWYVGWSAYYSMTQYPKQLSTIEAHVRRREITNSRSAEEAAKPFRETQRKRSQGQTGRQNCFLEQGEMGTLPYPRSRTRLPKSVVQRDVRPQNHIRQAAATLV